MRRIGDRIFGRAGRGCCRKGHSPTFRRHVVAMTATAWWAMKRLVRQNENHLQLVETGKIDTHVPGVPLRNTIIVLPCSHRSEWSKCSEIIAVQTRMSISSIVLRKNSLLACKSSSNATRIAYETQQMTQFLWNLSRQTIWASSANVTSLSIASSIIVGLWHCRN